MSPRRAESAQARVDLPDLLLRALERDAARVTEQELRRRQAVFASLAPAEREAVADIAHRTGLRLAALLAGEAGRDERLGRAIRGGL